MPTLSKLLIVTTAVSLLLPGVAAARNGAEASDTPQASVSASPEARESSDGIERMGDANAKVKIEASRFCSRFDNATDTVSGETNARFTKLNDDFTARKAKVTSEFADSDSKIAKNRTEADSKLSSKLSELDAKAATADQKTAVTAFKTSVLAAVAARRAAVDKANDTFRSGLEAALDARQSQLKTAATAYKTAVTAALAQAKASCAAGVSPATVRTNLRASLDAARTSLQTARQNAVKGNVNLDALKAAHKAAIDKANADFQTAIKAALAKLKAALGVTASPSVSPVPTAAH